MMGLTLISQHGVLVNGNFVVDFNGAVFHNRSHYNKSVLLGHHKASVIRVRFTAFSYVSSLCPHINVHNSNIHRRDLQNLPQDISLWE